MKFIANRLPGTDSFEILDENFRSVGQPFTLDEAIKTINAAKCTVDSIEIVDNPDFDVEMPERFDISQAI